MMYYGRFIFFMRSENLLCTRNCFLNLYKNASKNALKYLKETILPPKPKKPPTSFVLYVKHVKFKFIEESPNIKYAEILRKASKEWAKLDLTEKENFTSQYNKSLEVYMNELKEYNNSITSEQKQLWQKKKKEYMESNKQISNKRKYEILGKPKKPLNAYFSYLISKKNEKDPNMPNKEWIKSMTINWKGLSDAEKESYIIEANQLWAQYQKNLEMWEMKMIQSGHLDVVRSKILTKQKDTKQEKQE